MDSETRKLIEADDYRRIDILPVFNVIDPNDPLEKAHNEYLMEHYRNLNMRAEYESSWRRNPFTPLIAGLVGFFVTFVVLTLIFWK